MARYQVIDRNERTVTFQCRAGIVREVASMNHIGDCLADRLTYAANLAGRDISDAHPVIFAHEWPIVLDAIRKVDA